MYSIKELLRIAAWLIVTLLGITLATAGYLIWLS